MYYKLDNLPAFSFLRRIKSFVLSLLPLHLDFNGSYHEDLYTRVRWLINAKFLLSGCWAMRRRKETCTIKHSLYCFYRVVSFLYAWYAHEYGLSVFYICFMFSVPCFVLCKFPSLKWNNNDKFYLNRSFNLSELGILTI